MCKLFHLYLNGIATQLRGKQIRISDREGGEKRTLERIAR